MQLLTSIIRNTFTKMTLFFKNSELEGTCACFVAAEQGVPKISPFEDTPWIFSFGKMLRNSQLQLI